jgi:dihydropteroate synthase
MHWALGNHRGIELSTPCVVGILNVTPDSFAVRHADPIAARDAAWAMVAGGAAMLDVGAESTRPGAAPVPPEEQIARATPVIASIRASPGALGAIPLSIDTTSARVARAALDAGVDAINDTSAGRDDDAMLALASHRRAGLVLMHRLRAPNADRYSDRYDVPPAYADVVEDVAAFLAERAHAAEHAGCDPASIVIDPGLGFGKTVDQNLRLINATPRLAGLGYPVMSGLSRKSFVGRVALGRDSTPEERLAGTLALSVLHLRRGACMFRVHDVAEHVQALAAARRLGE